MPSNSALTKTSSTESQALTRPGDWRRPEFDRALDGKAPLISNQRLVPAEYCRQIVAMPDDPRARPDEAAGLAKQLVSSYPQKKAADPEGYARALVVAFAKFPPRVGFRAIEKLILEKPFFPTAADVYAACSAIHGVGVWRRARAQQMLTERARRDAEAERRAVIERDREKVTKKIEGAAARLLASLPPMPIDPDD